MESSLQIAALQMAAQPPPPSLEDRLFGLPAELRDCIVNMAVTQPHKIEIDVLRHGLRKDGTCGATPWADLPRYDRESSRSDGFCPKLHPLAMTCQQACAEVTSAYYRENTFSIKLHTDGSPVATFLKWLECGNRAPGHRNAIVTNMRRVSLYFDVGSATHWDISHRRYIEAELLRDAEIEVEYDIDDPAGEKTPRCDCRLDEVLDRCNAAVLPSGSEMPNRLITYVLELEAFMQELACDKGLSGICHVCEGQEGLLLLED